MAHFVHVNHVICVISAQNVQLEPILLVSVTFCASHVQVTVRLLRLDSVCVHVFRTTTEHVMRELGRPAIWTAYIHVQCL